LKAEQKVQVDFYQLGDMPLEQVIGSISEKLFAQNARLLIVAEDEGLLTRLNRMLWDQGPTSFLPHGLAGHSEDARQPILLSTSPDAPNLARNILIADGQWREAALAYDRAFHLFDESNVEDARLAWKLLAGREGVERRYWKRESGRWVQAA
jgi:DNA polymerase-3 subunit chi